MRTLGEDLNAWRRLRRLTVEEVADAGGDRIGHAQLAEIGVTARGVRASSELPKLRA
jgi:hypothetical protein